MVPGIFNPKIYKGSPWNIEITLTDGNNSPIDITGWFGVFQIRLSSASDMVLASGAPSIISPLEGKMSLSLTGKETADIKTRGLTFSDVDKYAFSLSLAPSIGSELSLWLVGTAYVSPGGNVPV